MKSKVGFGSICLMFLLTAPAEAYKIRPYFVSAQSLKVIHRKWLEGVAPVHEVLTRMSLACAQANPYSDAPCTMDQLDFDKIDGDHPLIAGCHWPDDPNNLFSAKRPDLWAYWLTEGEKLSKDGKLDRGYWLTYRSHFFDLQFLHSMGMKGQTAAGVREDVIEWCRFAFSVAVGDIEGDKPLAQLVDSYPFIKHLRGTGPFNLTVRQLFTNIGEKWFEQKGFVKSKEYLKDVNAVNLRWRAAGALLHTIQDSYSLGHCERELTGDDHHPPTGAIKAFLDYSAQDSHLHSAKDIQPYWSTEAGGEDDGPILHGAWVIRRVLAKKAWDPEVDAYFRTRIFPLSPDAKSPYGGICAGK